MIGPISPDVYIERARTVPGVRLVGNAADFEEAKTVPPAATPAIYVLIEESGDSAIGVTGLPMQNITVTVKLIMWVRNAGGAQRVVADMLALERGVRRVFFGWHPDKELRPLTLRASGNDEAFGSHLVRQVLLTTRYRHTTETTP